MDQAKAHPVLGPRAVCKSNSVLMSQIRIDCIHSANMILGNVFLKSSLSSYKLNLDNVQKSFL